MRRILIGAALLALAYLGAREVVFAMASDETKIRRALAAEAAAFNRGAAWAVLASFAPDYRDATTGLSREALRSGLMWLFQNRRDPDSGEFRYRLVIDADQTVQVDGDLGTATLPLRLQTVLGGTEETIWELVVEAELERRDGEWRVVRSKHRTVRGAQPR